MDYENMNIPKLKINVEVISTLSSFAFRIAKITRVFPHTLRSKTNERYNVNTRLDLGICSPKLQKCCGTEGPFDSSSVELFNIFLVLSQFAGCKTKTKCNQIKSLTIFQLKKIIFFIIIFRYYLLKNETIFQNVRIVSINIFCKNQNNSIATICLY